MPPQVAAAAQKRCAEQQAKCSRNQRRPEAGVVLTTPVEDHGDDCGSRAEEPPQKLVAETVEQTKTVVELAHADLEIAARGQCQKTPDLARQSQRAERRLAR